VLLKNGIDYRKIVKIWLENIESLLKIPITIISTGEDIMCTIDRRAELGLKR